MLLADAVSASIRWWRVVAVGLGSWHWLVLLMRRRHDKEANMLLLSSDGNNDARLLLIDPPPLLHASRHSFNFNIKKEL